MLSDRKLTGLKSKMEINKLTPLSDREAGHACWRLGGQAAADEGQPCTSIGPAPRETTEPQEQQQQLTADLPVSGCIL